MRGLLSVFNFVLCVYVRVSVKLKMTEKRVLVCLGKRRRPVCFTSNPQEEKSDKSIITKKVREEFDDVLNQADLSLIIQQKDLEWDEWVDILDDANVPNKSVLQVVSEERKVSSLN